jgi:hypothetical protein
MTFIDQENNRQQEEKESRPLPAERIEELRKFMHVEGSGTYFSPNWGQPGIRLFETNEERLAWKT